MWTSLGTTGCRRTADCSVSPSIWMARPRTVRRMKYTMRDETLTHQIVLVRSGLSQKGLGVSVSCNCLRGRKDRTLGGRNITSLDDAWALSRAHLPDGETW